MKKKTDIVEIFWNDDENPMFQTFPSVRKAKSYALKNWGNDKSFAIFKNDEFVERVFKDTNQTEKI